MVILVDDSDDTANLFRYALESDKFDWKVFTNGFEAMDYLEKVDRVAAVILDLAMPTLDGLTIAQEIRLNEKLHGDREPVKIAFFTAYDKTKPIERVIEETNVERFFRKPMLPDKLASEVHEWLK